MHRNPSGIKRAMVVCVEYPEGKPSILTIKLGVVIQSGSNTNKNSIMHRSHPKIEDGARKESILKNEYQCVMSILSGQLRRSCFPSFPEILPSKDWANVSVTDGISLLRSLSDREENTESKKSRAEQFGVGNAMSEVELMLR